MNAEVVTPILDKGPMKLMDEQLALMARSEYIGRGRAVLRRPVAARGAAASLFRSLPYFDWRKEP